MNLQVRKVCSIKVFTRNVAIYILYIINLIGVRHIIFPADEITQCCPGIADPLHHELCHVHVQSFSDQPMPLSPPCSDQRMTQDVDKWCDQMTQILPNIILSPGIIAYYTYKTFQRYSMVWFYHCRQEICMLYGQPLRVYIWVHQILGACVYTCMSINLYRHITIHVYV